MIVWLVGLSGAGKTTIARALHRQWQAVSPATVLIDGDEVREIFQHDRGPDAYTMEGRRINAERIAAMSAWLAVKRGPPTLPEEIASSVVTSRCVTSPVTTSRSSESPPPGSRVSR